MDEWIIEIGPVKIVAPDFANWFTVDSDGMCWVYAEKPVLKNKLWQAQKGTTDLVWIFKQADIFNGMPPYPDWQSTLLSRDQGQTTLPFHFQSGSA